MVVPLHGSFKDKLRRCLQAGSVPAMMAASIGLTPSKADAALVFRPGLDQVIDLNLILPTETRTVTFDLDMNGFFDGNIIIDPQFGGIPGVADHILFGGSFQIFGAGTVGSVPVVSVAEYDLGDFISLVTLGTSDGSGNVPLSLFDPGFFVGMQFDGGVLGTVPGYFKVEFDALANTVSLTNFAYEDNTVVPALVAALAGDLNGDGFVGIDDLNIVLLNWNQFIPPGDPVADRSGDGFVGIDDLNIVLINWNNGTPPASGTSIPEPGSMAVLVAGAAGVLSRRRGRV